MLDTLIRILADGELHSGVEIGRTLGVTRSAVWKSLKALESFGLTVVSEQSKGYRLSSSLDLLDPASLAQLSGLSLASNLEVLGSTASTNTYLSQKYLAGELSAPFHACFAEHQSAGRGRRGRAWLSPYASNLYGSFCCRFDQGFGFMSGFSLAVGAILCKHLSQAYGVEGLGLKWPNDIYIEGQKLGGILIELFGEQAGPVSCIVGIGLNVQLTESERQSIDQPATSLSTVLGDMPTRTELAASLARLMRDSVEIFSRSGFAGYKAVWNEFDVMRGREVKVSGLNRVLTGRCVGVDDYGNLLLEGPEGMEVLSGGELSLRGV